MGVHPVALVLATVAAAIALAGCSPEPTPMQTFGTWYPPTNDAGDEAFADFENHVPCSLDEPPNEACERIKLGIVLYRDAAGEPTTYLISIIRVAVSDDRETIQGQWTIEEGTALDPDATVYELDAAAPEHLRHWWPIGEDILFLLDGEKMPRVGDAAYGFALNSIPIGRP